MSTSQFNGASDALLAAIVESSDDAIVSKTLNGIVQSWNAGAQRIFGYTAAEMIGRSILTLIPAELQDEEKHILEKVRRGERVDHFDTVRVSKDGRRIPISLTVSPVRDASGQIVAASKVARDISDRKLAEVIHQESDRRKDEFLAMLAHELRNPLAPIRYAVALMNNASVGAEQQAKARDIVERQLAHMSRLLDDLLDISRISKGKLELKQSMTDLASILSAAIETARPVMEAKGHELEVDLPTMPLPIMGDTVRLSQVFSNLLLNAAKFTDVGGHVSIRVRALDHRVSVSISDDGCGIDAALMPRLFSTFTQAPLAHSRPDGGLGVGLALVRALVQLHGGDVTARSDGAGRGSEFTVVLPSFAQMSEDPAPSQPVQTLTTSMSILVVDDNQDAADSCGILLELDGHEVTVAYNGTDGLKSAEKARPHVMLLDIGLPDLNGYQIAKRVRQSSWGQGISLVAITGWGQEYDKSRALAAGFDRHLTKPVSLEQLRSALLAVTRPSFEAGLDPTV